MSATLYGLVVLGTTLIQCLLAVWTATSPRPRLVRALVVWLAIVVLIPIQAYWPALFFTLNALSTAALIALVRYWHRDKWNRDKSQPSESRLKFGIGDLFVVLLVIGTLLTLAGYCRLTVANGAATLALGCLTLAPLCAWAYWTVIGQARFRAAAVGLAVTFVLAGLLVWLDLGQALRIAWLSGTGHERLPWHLLSVGSLGATAALFLWLALQLSRKPPQVWKRMLLQLALVATGTLGALLVNRFSDDLWYDGLPLLQSCGPGWLVIWAALIVVALAVAGVTRLQRRLESQPPPQWARLVRVAGLAAGSLLALPAGWIYWQMLWPPQFPPLAASGVNHYDRLAAISRQLAERQQGTSPPPVAPSPLLDEALSLLAGGNNGIPVSALEAELQGDYRRTMRHQDVRALGEPLTALRDKCTKPAEIDRGADYALATVQLETMLQRGGLTANAALVPRHAFRADQWLADHAELLSEEKSREVIGALNRSLAERDEPELFAQREYIYSQRVGGWCSRLQGILGCSRAKDPMRDELFHQVQAHRLLLRGLQVLYAVRLFQLDHGRLPTALDQLAPQYLTAVPLDPYSGRPLVYQPGQNTYRLYSIGPDQKDDGGHFITRPMVKDTGFDWDLSWEKRKRPA